ncbi:hypothetical protein Leryth_026354 [Lithospermum erythrorhizon]|nr:hypothetical protein Leryth_026354 [Lithospermum erythrorhizon]
MVHRVSHLSPSLFLFRFFLPYIVFNFVTSTFFKHFLDIPFLKIVLFILAIILSNLLLIMQWIDGVLAKEEYANFFHDEYRCPVYIKDLVTIIVKITNKWISDGERRQHILNVGGPDRVSRIKMAEVVAEVRGYNNSVIKPVSASSVDRGVNSPSDISMDITRLIQIIGISPTSFTDGVRLTLDSET